MISEKKFYTLLICLSLIICTPAISFSDTELLKEDYKAAGISEKSRFFPGNADNQLNRNSPPESALLKVSEKSPQGIVQHFNSTKGVEIAPQKIKLNTEDSAKGMELSNKVLDKSAEKLIKSNTTIDQIPNCSKNETLKFMSANSLPAGKEIFLFDILYLRKADLPLDPELIFGPGVQIMVYDQSKMTPQNAAIQGAMIPCLPFRMRGTSSFIFRDYGVNALKDYSKDPNGSGVLNEALKSKANSR